MANLNLHSKEVLAKEKAIATMAKRTSDDLQDLAQTGTKNALSDNLEHAKDLTASVLCGPTLSSSSLPASCFRLYRGMLRRFESIVSGKQAGLETHGVGRKIALLGGTSSSIIEAVIIHGSISESLDHPELAERWKSSCFIPVGLVIWEAENADESEQPSMYKDLLIELKSPNPVLLLMVFGKALKQKSWELAFPSSGSSTDLPEFREVHVNTDGENRRKNEKYVVCDILNLGVTLCDQASTMIQAAICQQVKTSLEASAEKARMDNDKKQTYFLYKVPADGLCFWHCICAGKDPGNWCSIPRKSSAYAQHPSNVKLEEARAKALFRSVVDLSRHCGDETYAKAADLKERSGVVDVSDVPWICKLLGVKIRVTLQPEAGGAQNVFLSLYSPIPFSANIIFLQASF